MSAPTKNDLRAWIVEGHNYIDLAALGETFAPKKLDDTLPQMSRHDAILKHLGLLVIGMQEGSDRIEIFSEHTKQSTTIHDIDRLSLTKLIQLVGYELVEKYIHDGKETPPGKFEMKEVRHAIAASSCGKVFHAEDKLGAGVWKIDHQLIILKAKEAGLLNGTGKIESSYVPFFGGRTLDIGSTVKNWVDFGDLNRLLVECDSDEFCQRAFKEAEDLFSHWFWRRKNTPRVLAAPICCTWIQSIWEWCPQVFLTGESDTGKSILVDDVLNKGIFGDLSMYVVKPTEAAIRQHMKHHSKVLIVDEFEHDSHRQRILELFRTSSRGGETIRGTADQRGAGYKLHHIPWFVAVETGLRKQADRNRYIVLELDRFHRSLTPRRTSCLRGPICATSGTNCWQLP